MLRRLLNIPSVVCLVACVALIAMWVRSYQAVDVVRGNFTYGELFAIYSVYGHLEISGAAITNPIAKSWMISSFPCDDKWTRRYTGHSPSTGRLGFAVSALGGSAWSGYKLTLPYWFMVLAIGSLAMLFRLRWPLRFNLRGLFIATTFLAVVLGLIAMLDRPWIGK
jgi:hypothetical protein